MAKAFNDDYSSFKIETVKPKSAPKRRRFRLLSTLFWLVLGWALLQLAMEKTGSLWTLLNP